MLELHKYRHVVWKPSPVVALAASLDGAVVAAARGNGAIEIWSVAAGSVGWHRELVPVLGIVYVHTFFSLDIMWLLERISSYLFSPVDEQQNDLVHPSYNPQDLEALSDGDPVRTGQLTYVNDAHASQPSCNPQDLETFSDGDPVRTGQLTYVNDAHPGQPRFVNDADYSQGRTEKKLKGYFSLAKSEIDKALRADEQKMVAAAIKHYQAASMILKEGISIPVVSESDITAMYLEKMLNWIKEVDERLEILLIQLQSHGNVPGSFYPSGSNLSKATFRPSTTGVLQSGCSKGKSSTKGAGITSKRTGFSQGSLSFNLKRSSSSTLSSEVPRGVDPKLAKIVEDEIVDRTPNVSWNSIAGLEKAKQALMEMVILPIRRSDLFSGLRNPTRGLLLFGPPGNGKTLLAKAVASESSATFFCIGASSLTSKWVGEGEKLVRALFAIARDRQPSVIFIDEIDSIMSSRSSNEHEASRRLKSEFLVQFDGVLSGRDYHVVVMGATNRPQDIDDAVRRRLVKRIYIPLPDVDARRELLRKLLKGKAFSLPGSDIEHIAWSTEGYSGSDLYALCQEAAMLPIRELGTRVNTVRVDQVRPLAYHDFEKAMRAIRPSVSTDQLEQFEDWNEKFGSK